ncbi:MAG: NAD-dependent epimerase/dehydratase family protein [Phycisphaera sp.]|nr:MAG: NAD-dependent epimerase/dehydratase family protein [Phycisphaera sp.]
MPEPSTYIVTGGAGFVGSNCCAALSRARPDAQIICIDDFRVGSFRNLVEAYDRHELGPVSCEVIAQDWTYLLTLIGHKSVGLVHMAAITDTTVEDQAQMLDDNAGPAWDGLLESVLEAGHKLVYASSAATYGTPTQAAEHQPFPLDAAGKPDNIYGFSKWVMENSHRRVQQQDSNASIVGLRFFNVFGPGESNKGAMASMAYKLAQQMLAGTAPRLFTPGDQARDQVYVDDVVDCVLAGLGLGDFKQPTPGVYNLGSGKPTTFNQLTDAVRAGLGLKASELPTEYFDMPANVRRFYQDFTLADMAQTERGLGFTPTYDPVEAITGYASYLKQHSGAKR